jgi:hypothetical protein
VDVRNELFLCLGYACLCGEQVTVFRLPINSGMPISVATKTVSCSNGHARTVTVDQLAILDHWTEEQQEELKTGT